MNKLGFQVRQVTQKSHTRQQPEQHNRSRWRGFVAFTFFVFSLVSNVKTIEAQTWQETLEQNFDVADTFDHYQDWTPTATQDCSVNNLPKKLDGASGIWGNYCLWGVVPPAEPVITDNGPTKQVGTKSLRLNPPYDIKTYVGNGTPDSGYSDIYIFFRIYLPRNGFPTRILGYPSETKVEVDYVEGEPYTWWDSFKFVNIGTGFNDVYYNWNNQGFSVYGDTSNWYHLFRGVATDLKSLEPRLQTHGAQRGVRGAAGKIILDKLIGMELHYKLEEPAGYGEGFTGNGVAEMWVYDENGNAELVLQATDMSFRPASGEGHLINRIWFNGNKHIQAKHWVYGPGMEKAYYIDDFIIDDQRIGPKYFFLLDGTTPLTGDVQCDKAVDVLDVQALVNCILGAGNCDWGCGNSADVNSDDSVDVLDVQEVVNIILGG